ncbi:MAG TPA: stalk domain-containing protein, partial [Thermoanaerobaculia bacterium]|nr:stalk domain-containing protein [Thermoanaerobaculia bacterium]
MKRFLPLLVLAAATILLAQSPNQATLRMPSGDRAITMTNANGQTLFAADEILAALGGAVSPDGTGFKATLNNTMAAFGPDSRFAVVRDELIEMPVAPAIVDGRPYAPLQF